MEPSSRQGVREPEQPEERVLQVLVPASSTCCLIVLIGLPGSGKSTLARQVIAECPDCWLISTDAIRAHLFGDEATQGPWMQVWQQVQRQFHQAAQQIKQGVSRAAIYDATNVQRKQRRRVLSLARATGFNHIVGLWLDVPLRMCLSRNQQRDRVVPEFVMQKMYRQLIDAPPAMTEGLERLIYYSETPTTVSLEELLSVCGSPAKDSTTSIG
jgi:predicted kinase